MKDPERRVPEAERVQDLEVKEDEAREVGGGKKAERSQHKRAGRFSRIRIWGSKDS